MSSHAVPAHSPSLTYTKDSTDPTELLQTCPALNSPSAPSYGNYRACGTCGRRKGHKYPFSTALTHLLITDTLLPLLKSSHCQGAAYLGFVRKPQKQQSTVSDQSFLFSKQGKCPTKKIKPLAKPLEADKPPHGQVGTIQITL